MKKLLTIIFVSLASSLNAMDIYKCNPLNSALVIWQSPEYRNHQTVKENLDTEYDMMVNIDTMTLVKDYDGNLSKKSYSLASTSFFGDHLYINNDGLITSAFTTAHPYLSNQLTVSVQNFMFNSTEVLMLDCRLVE